MNDKKPKKTVTITIDGEEFEVEKEEMTARELLALAGLDPGVSYLILLQGQGKQVSFRDNLDEPIKIHERIRFVSADLGAAPVA
jgi:Multiubiquitin